MKENILIPGLKKHFFLIFGQTLFVSQEIKDESLYGQTVNWDQVKSR